MSSHGVTLIFVDPPNRKRTAEVELLGGRREFASEEAIDKSTRSARRMLHML